MRATLRQTDFRLLIAGQFASNVGDLFYAIALPWYVLEHRGGTLLLGTVLAAYGIPRTVLVAIGGRLADRFAPWSVMLIADAARTVAVLVLAVFAVSGPAQARSLIPVALVLGACEGLFLPCSFAIIPSLLPDAQLQSGNALATGTTQLATLIGPAFGGIAVSAVGTAAAFGVDAVSFAVSAATLLGIRAVARTAQAVHRKEAQRDAAAAGSEPQGGTLPGVSETIRATRSLQVAFLITFVANLASGGLGEIALPALAHGPLHADAGGYGAMLTAIGAGALLGTLLAGHRPAPPRPAIVGSVAFLAEAAMIAPVPYVGGIASAVALLIPFGACNSFGNVTMLTAFQRWAPRHLLGSLTGILMLTSFGTFPLSVLISGTIVHAHGPAVFFPIAAAVLAVPVALGMSLRSWREFGIQPVSQ